MVLTTAVFLADDVHSLRDQVNAFLRTVPRFRVKDIQYGAGQGWRQGANPVFGAWVVYEVEE